MEAAKEYLKRHRVVLAVAAFLIFGSGCAGVVKETGDQFTEDAMSPVTVPIREGNKAIDKLNTIETQQEAHNAELEDIR